MRTAKLYNFVPVCRQKIRLRLSAQFPNGRIPERRAGGGGDIRQIGERRPRASPSRRNGNAVTRNRHPMTRSIGGLTTVAPPSTGRIAPVTDAALSEARNVQVDATSGGVAARRSGTFSETCR